MNQNLNIGNKKLLFLMDFYLNWKLGSLIPRKGLWCRSSSDTASIYEIITEDMQDLALNVEEITYEVIDTFRKVVPFSDFLFPARKTEADSSEEIFCTRIFYREDIERETNVFRWLI